MAQRTFPCTSCGAPIEVPDDYFKSQIGCPACGMPHHRLTGNAVNAASPLAPATQPAPAAARPPFPRATGVPYPNTAQPLPQARPGGVPYPQPTGQPFPRQGAPYPAPFPGQAYPGQFGSYAPLPQKSNKGLIIGISIAGGVVLLILILAAIPLIAGSASNESSEDWYEYTSASGGYSVKFPKKPLEDSSVQQTALGPRTMYRALCTSGGVQYQVIYFDLGQGDPSEYEWDPNGGFSGAADAMKGRVVSTSTTTLAGQSAPMGIIENDNGYRGELATLRVGNRVYIVGCERGTRLGDIKLKVFTDTFKLGSGQVASASLEDQWRALYKPGASWTYRTTTNMNGVGPQTSCHRIEVKSVDSKVAKVKFVMLDKDMKPMSGMGDVLNDVPMPKAAAGSRPPKELGRGQEKIGSWETTWIETGDDHSRQKTWQSAQYGPHLIIKSIVTFSGTESVTELVDFTPGQ